MISFIQAGRGGGKTWTIMSEIHEMILAGRGREVLVVFPNMQYVRWWTGAWRSRFPHLPMPDYTLVNNALKVRGRRYSKIYVEDVDTIDDGIYSEKLREIRISLYSEYFDEEMIVTVSPIELNQRSHNRIVRSFDILKQRLADARRAKLHTQEDDGVAD